MGNITDIVTGFTNLLKNKLHISEQEIEELASKRMDVCNECSIKNTLINVCTDCGCYLPAKTRNLKEKCPKDKWKKVRN